MCADQVIKRQDYEIITALVSDEATVLDLGCGDGSLLSHLSDTRNISGYGVERDD
jgi:cyclopropane fatty-acyl-phospholipid synthase-like methyltransferase